MTGCPFQPGRRGLLLGVGAGLVAARGAAQAADLPDDATRRSQPFWGEHQAGVTTPRQAAGLLAAFDVLAGSRDELEQLFRRLTGLAAFLMQGGSAPVQDALLPPPDSGVLGPQILPDDLTITVSVGASLFDDRYGLNDRKPRRLVRMPQFPNDALEAERCHGDLLLQICSNSAATNIHALRAVIKQFPDLVALRWKMDGFLPPRSVAGGPDSETARNLLGFKDGTANPDSGDAALMRRLVWVQAEGDEPAWAEGGTYQVVRLIRMLVERWDRTPLGEQQTIIGREKMIGAPLGLAKELDDPGYGNDQHGTRIPLTAHIRLANPRTPASEASLILRRPYNFSEGVTRAGQLEMGLLFVCFQADLQAGFVAVQRRLNGEPLEEYIKPIAGGYFFTLPGAKDKSRYLGDALLA